MTRKSLYMFSVALFCLSVLPFVSPWAAQEKFPTKPITIVIAQAAGGSTDIVGRALAPFMQADLKQPVVIQNAPGAGGDIGMNIVWEAKPDGYTIEMVAIPANVVRELTKKTAYHVTEMSMIYGITGGDFNAISVPANSLIKTFNDLKKMATEKAMSVGGTVIGSNSWYAYVLFKEATGAKLKYVPYESGTEAATAAGGGHVDLAITSIVSAFQPVHNGLIRLIATFGEKRSSDFPDVPTMIELGYKDVHFTTRFGLAGPPKLPKEIVATLANATSKAVQDAKFREIAERQGFSVDPLPPADFNKWIVATQEQAKKFLTKAGEIK